MTTVADLVPPDAQYHFDAAASVARVTIETRASRSGNVVYATIVARLTVVDDYAGQPMIEAEYVSHEGEATQHDIDYAIRVIETNDFGVGP